MSLYLVFMPTGSVGLAGTQADIISALGRSNGTQRRRKWTVRDRVGLPETARYAANRERIRRANDARQRREWLFIVEQWQLGNFNCTGRQLDWERGGCAVAA